MKVNKEKKFKDAIIKIKILPNRTLLLADSKSVVKFLDIKTLGLKSGFKLNIDHLEYKNSVIDFSSDASYFGVLSSNRREARLYDAKTKKMIAKNDRHKGETTCVVIDPKDKYVLSGGEDGRIYALSIETRKMAFMLPSHVDTVNDISFSDNAQWIATSSYDKKVHIFSTTMMGIKHKLIGHSSPVIKSHFLSKHRLMSIDNNNNGIIWDYYKGKVIARLEGIHDDVFKMTTSSDGRFLFLGTKLGYILVYELETYKMLSSNYIKLTSSITALEFDKDTDELIVGTKDGDILFYNIYEGEAVIKGLLQSKKYEEIHLHTEQNPLLEYTKTYKFLGDLWDITLKKAIHLLEVSDKKGAENLLKHFNNIPSKQSIIKNILTEYAEFDKFVLLVKSNKLGLAYSMTLKHPVYKDSKVYQSLEARWKKDFNLAQKYTSDAKGTQTAKDILAPYRGTTQKTKLIQELLSKIEVHKRFRKSVEKKDFKICFELIKQHPFLKELLDYEKLITFADSMYIQSYKLIEQGDNESALKILKVLIDFSDFTLEAKELMANIEVKQNFLNAFNGGNIESAYNYLSENEELQEIAEGIKLQEDWDKDMAIAGRYTADGNILELNHILNKYMKIDSKKIAIANIYSWCYIAQLEKAIKDKKDQSSIENGIKNYIAFFGLQDQIEDLFIIFKKLYKDSTLDLELESKTSTAAWKTSDIVNSILK
ncbi:MAG: hypothetical protein JJW00_09500 [Sulfurimonas sp.]|nr:hypothetical protein [Sulfurimonas sp.]